MKKSKQNHINSIVQGLFFGKVDQDSVFPFPGWKDGEGEGLREIIDVLQGFLSEKINSGRF